MPTAPLGSKGTGAVDKAWTARRRYRHARTLAHERLGRNRPLRFSFQGRYTLLTPLDGRFGQINLAIACHGALLGLVVAGVSDA